MLIKPKATSFNKYFSIVVLLFAIVLLSGGCQKKAEQPEGEKAKKDTTNMVTPQQSEADTTAMADTTQKYPDLTGTWKGTFDKRPTTFYITEQTGENFKGNMTIPYKKPLKKEISGSLKSGMQISMKDLTHSRFMGTYSGNISDDGSKISGTFTMNSDNSKYDFTFSKK